MFFEFRFDFFFAQKLELNISVPIQFWISSKVSKHELQDTAKDFLKTLLTSLLLFFSKSSLKKKVGLKSDAEIHKNSILGADVLKNA